MKPPAARPWAGSPYRRRRILWTALLLTLGTLYYLTQHGPLNFLSLPAPLKDLAFAPASSRAGRVAQAKAEANVREIDALLHFLTEHSIRRLDEHGGSDGAGSGMRVEGLGRVVVDPGAPVDLRVYAPDGGYDWEAYVRTLEARYPLVVFSKTYCPYSQRAKELLATYELSPAPEFIEVDARSDGPQIQAILARLTGRKTVPNVLVKGVSIGGSDDIHKLHDEHKLEGLLQDNGLMVNGAVHDAL